MLILEPLNCATKVVRTSEQPLFSLQKFDIGKLKETSRWHVTTFSVKVPTAIRETLKYLDKRVCPDKLKISEQIEISFAAKLKDDDTIVPLDIPLIYSYLPTNKRFKFPYLVNSNFLLNEARTQLLEVDWNVFLFEQIGYLQFQWFKRDGSRRAVQV